MKKRKPGTPPASAGEKGPAEEATAPLRDRIADLERKVAALQFAEEQANLVREQFADLYDYAPVGYLTVDEKSVIHRVNLPAAALLGGSRQELTGARLLSFVRPGEKKACAEFLKGAFSAAGPTTFECGLLPGKWRAEHVQLVASPAAAGRDLGHAGVQVRLAILDVSDRKRADEALRASERKFEAVVSAMADGVVVHDPTGAIVMCNTAAERILGLTADEIRGRTSVDPRWRVVHEDGTPFPGEEHPAAVALRTGRSRWNVVMGVHRSDGSLVWIQVNAEPLRNGEGSVQGVVVTFTDITRRKSAEQALEDALGQLRRHLTSTPLGLVEWDAEFRVTRFSARAEAIFGRTEAEVLGKRIDEVPWVAEEDWPPVKKVLKDLLEGVRPPYVNVSRCLRKDGSVIYCEWYNSPLHGADGKLVSVFSLVQDVTDREQDRASPPRS